MILRRISLHVLLLTLPAACGKGGGSSGTTPPKTPPDSNDAVSTKGGGCYPVGIAASDLGLLPLVDPEWAPVRNGATPHSQPVLVHGTVVESHVSRGDFPATHRTYDQNTALTLDAADAGLLATGNTGVEGETLELEWEVGSYPDWAWADAGDRVVAMGRWIFDCGHPDPVPGTCAGTTKACVLDSDCGGAACQGTQFNYRSELHPPQASAVIRSGRGAALADAGGVVPVTRADLFVSGDGGGAGDECVVTHRDVGAILGAPCFPLQAPLALLPSSAPPLATDFEVDVPLPPAPAAGASAVWQLLPQTMPDGSLPSVQAAAEISAVLTDPSPFLHVKLLMSQAVNGKLPTGYASILIAGWKQTAPTTLQHVRVTVTGVVVHDALKPVPSAGLDPPAGWHLETSIDGQWRRLPGLDTIAAGAEGTTVDTSSVVYDLYLPADGALTVEASGASRVCVDSMFGQSLAASLAQFGNDLNLAGACLQTTEPDAGTVKASFPGPDFGQGPHEIASDVGAYSLRFRVDLPPATATVAARR